MKLALFAAAVLVAMTPAKGAIQIDQTYSNLNSTDVLADLMTSEEFAKRYQAGEFDKPFATPSRYEGFQFLTMTNGLSNYAETFFYVWNARGEQPKYQEYDADGFVTGVSTYDVGYSVSMSVTGDFTDFSSYRLQFVDASSDWMFLKFKCSYDFRSVFKDAEYQAYEISEFEITDSPVSPTKSNAYSISKRFAFSGETVTKVDDISTVILDPRASYYRIPGINGRGEEDISEDGYAVFHNNSSDTLDIPEDDPDHSTWTTMNGWVGPNENFSTQATDVSRIRFDADFTDVFYLTFDFDERQYGEIIGAKMTYDIVKEVTAYKTINSWVEGFGNWPDMLEEDARIEQYVEWVPMSKTVYLSTGDVGPYEALVNLKSLPGQRGEHNIPTWWTDRVAWCYGNAAEFDLPTIQTLEPIDLSGNYKTEPGSNEIVDMSNNPYAIDDDTAAYLKTHKPTILSGTKQYIFRFAMEDATLWTNTRCSSKAVNWLPFHYLTHKTVNNANVLQLTCRKDGVIYTIAVVSDNKQIETDASLPSNVPGYTFDWTWLYIALGIIGAIIIAKIVVWGWKKVTAK